MEHHTAVIIVSFGRTELMCTTLRSLLATKDDRISITVVDNGSLDETIGLLVQYRKHIDNLVLMSKNCGKPYAWNLGVSVAIERCKILNKPKPTHYLFCDNDLEFLPGWHKKMVDTYEDHKSLPLCGLSGMRWPTHQLDVRQGKTTQINIVRFPPGCCVMIADDIYQRTGAWDTARLIRTVDTRYFRNAQNKGYLNGSVYPDTVINHTGRMARSWHLQTGEPKLFP